MVVTQGKSKKKKTGGRIVDYRSKRKYEKGNLPANTKLGDKKLKTVRTKGGNSKTKQMSNNTINVTDQKAKKTYKTEIKGVLENPANRHYVRRNILTKGTVVETAKGKAMITSRPGQQGVLNAVLVE